MEADKSHNLPSVGGRPETANGVAAVQAGRPENWRNIGVSSGASLRSKNMELSNV